MKRIGILLLLIFSIAISGRAQISLLNDLSFYSNNQQIINDAMEGGLVIASQSYQLEDTTSHQRFGRYGRPEFGKGYSIGVKTAKGIIVTEDYVEPWKNDPNFARYRNSHKPMRFKQQERALNDSVLADRSFDVESSDTIASNLYLLRDSTLSCKEGFALDTIEGDKNGWLVWVVSDEAISASDSVFSESLMIYKKDLTVSCGNVPTRIESPNTDKTVWGGIYVVPKQTAVGQMTFFLCGIAVKDEKGDWSVSTPFASLKTDPDPVPPQVDDLTPVVSGDAGDDVDKETGNKKSKTKKS